MPPARRKPSRPSTDSPGLQIDLDGQTYIVRQADLTPRDVAALRKATGMSWVGLAKALQADPDIDLIAALVWLARRTKGQDADYDSVLDELSYESDLSIKVEDKRTSAKADEGDDSPEA